MREVLATNKARRARLADVARDRLGYQEYLDLRDSVDRNISAAYARLQKKDVPKASKKKRPPVPPNGVGHGQGPGEGALPPCPAMLGLNVDDEHVLGVPETLEKLVRTRRQWVNTVGAVFEEKQREQPGRIWGFPESSLFKGIEDEVRAEVGSIRWGAGPPAAGGTASAAGGSTGSGSTSGSSTSGGVDKRTGPDQVKMELG